MTTGQRIRAARQKKGVTQANLAERLGIPYQSIGQWERDVPNPKPGTLMRIAKALEKEPLKWRPLVHLLIDTGIRRGGVLCPAMEERGFQVRDHHDRREPVLHQAEGRLSGHAEKRSHPNGICR